MQARRAEATLRKEPTPPLLHKKMPCAFYNDFYWVRDVRRDLVMKFR